MKSTIVLAVVFVLCHAEEKIRIKDTYLDAYYNSKTNLSGNKNDRIDKSSPFYDGQEKIVGPPHYGQEFYGPPHGYSEMNSYGPPVYGPPVPSYPMSSFHGMPHALMGLLDKLHLKLDIFTILKIILKLVIFKKLISFIAILCLLLFIPKFKPPHMDMESDEYRSFTSTKSRTDEHINVLTDYVVNAIENYSGKTNKTCDGISCSILQDIDNKYSYERLVTLYSQ